MRNVFDGEAIAIVGLGGVGMMGLQFARAMFPDKKIIGCDIDAAKLESAKAAGAFAVYNSKDADSLKQLKLDTGGGVAAAVDFVGSTPSLNYANGAIRRGGEIIVVGLFGGKFATPIPSFPGRPFSIVGSYTGPLGENARDDDPGAGRQDQGNPDRGSPAGPGQQDTGSACAKAQLSGASC